MSRHVDSNPSSGPPHGPRCPDPFLDGLVADGVPGPPDALAPDPDGAFPDRLAVRARTDESAVAGVTVLGVAGEVDLSTVHVLSGAIADALCRPGVEVVVVDLDGVRFLSSTGVVTLLDAHEAARRRGARLVLAAGGRTAERILRLTGAWRRLEHHPTVAAARLAERAGSLG